MSALGEAIFEFLFEALFALFWRLFHATGRRLIYLLTFGGTGIPSAGGRDASRWSDVWAAWAGFLFWRGASAGLVYRALA